MNFIDLTIPLDYEWMPDEVLPTSNAFLLAPRETSPDKGFSAGNDTGTCLLMPSQFEEFRTGPKVHEIPPERLFMRSTSVVSVAAGAGCAIDAPELAAAIDEAALEQGDAVLLRSRWGDELASMRGTDRYMLDSPWLTVAAAELLVTTLASIGSELLLCDLAWLSRPGWMLDQWVLMTPRPRPFPSEAAKAYLRGLTRDRVRDDFAADYVFAAAGVTTVRKLVNCGDLPDHFQAVVAPLHLVRGIGATCRVIAVLDQATELAGVAR